MELVKIMLTAIACHLVGDYVLQSDYIAKTKGENWWHLIVHCFLYTVPFYVMFQWHWVMAIIFVTHIVIDTLKARWKIINYATDQMLHYCVICLVLILYYGF